MQSKDQGQRQSGFIVHRAMVWASGRAELVSVVVALICYLNILPNDFTHDSVSIVERNPRVNEPGQWRAIWTTDYWWHTASEVPNRDLLFRPVALCSFRIIRMVFGPSPLPQNVCNLLLHAVVCACLVRLARHLGATPRQALVAGVLFAVLPIHTEAVAATVGRADLLATLGVLLTLLFHRRMIATKRQSDEATKGSEPGAQATGQEGGTKAPGNGRLRLGWCVTAAFAAFVSVGSKESAIGILLLVPLFGAYWRNIETFRRFDAGAKSGSRRVGVSMFRRSPSWLRRFVAPSLSSLYLLLPVGAYLALRYYALGGELHQRPAVSKTVNVLVDAPWWQHILGVMQLWGMYWEKTFWPAILSVNYSINAIRLATGLGDRFVLWGLAITALLFIASVMAWRRGSPLVALLFAAVLITYAPTSNAFVLLRVFFAERIWYLPSVWVALLIGVWMIPAGREGSSILHFRSSIANPSPKRRRGVSARSLALPALIPSSLRRFVALLRAFVGVSAVLLMASMTFRCWVRNADWRNNGTLCAAAYRAIPQSIEVLHMYGQWLVLQGDFARGIELLHRAIEMDLGYTQAHRTLGLAYFDAGDYAHALHFLQIANMQVPDYPPVVKALERTRLALRDSHVADIRELEEQTQKAPESLDAELALIRKLREVGRAEEALKRLQERENRFADRAPFQAEYAVTLVFLNKLDEAVERYRRSLQQERNNPQPAVELAMLLLERREGNDLEEAWSWATHAGTLAPQDPTVLVCQAELLAVRGDIAGALERYRKAIDRLPSGSPQRKVYEQRAKSLGQ